MLQTQDRSLDGTALERGVCASFLVLVVLLSAGLRIEGALASGLFDQDPVGSVRSDPGLLYYLAERVVDSGGAPEDWRRDPRIEHPGSVDLPARFTVGSEWVLLLARRLVGDGVPLHILCIWVMGLLAALAAVGVYGLTLELTRSGRWALLAALVYVLTPASYRTLGFVLVREDVSLPLFALHLWLAARAVRLRSWWACILAGSSLGLTLATWQAASILVTLEAAACFLWFLRSDRSPFDCPRAGLALLIVCGMAISVPALAAKGALLSASLVLWQALWCASRFGRGRRGRIVVSLVALVVLCVAGFWLSWYQGTLDDFGHVGALILAKLSHVGLLPTDPQLLSFDTRMMWQGPFATLGPGAAHSLLLLTFWLLPPLILANHLRAMRREGGDVERVLHLLLLFLCLGSWLILRVSAALAIVVSAALAAAGRRAAGEGRALLPRLGILGLLFFQSLGFADWWGNYSIPWQWPLRQAQERALVSAVQERVPEGQALVADFMSSTVVLAHTGRPIVVQPKWETAASRRRVERLWELLYRASARELADAMLGEFDARYLLLDRHTLLWLKSSRYLAGIESEAGHTPPGSALESLLAGDTSADFDPPERFELLWSSEAVDAFPDGTRRDLFRLFRVHE